MLINFTLKNWMSYKDSQRLIMTAGDEERHENHKIALQNYGGMDLLPIAAIYGGNASGKTNLCKALRFFKNLVTEWNPQRVLSSDGIALPFLLDNACKDQPSEFCIDILVDNQIYEYSVSVLKDTVLAEKLSVFESADKETVLFDRGTNTEIFLNPDIIEPDLRQRLELVFKGTQDSQLFLNNVHFQRIDYFDKVFNWFADTLQVLHKDERSPSYYDYFVKNSKNYNLLNEALKRLDTGISRLDSERVPLSQLNISFELLNKLSHNLPKIGGIVAQIENEDRLNRFIVRQENESFIAEKLVTVHDKTSGEGCNFYLEQESDGTLRLLDILPLILALQQPELSTKVFVVDEFNRSLHPNLTRALISDYLRSCQAKNKNKQLIFTTHDVSLIDKRLLRLDEIWVTERDNEGAANLCSFADYKEADTDLKLTESYLTGRLGGVPKIS